MSKFIIVSRLWNNSQIQTKKLLSVAKFIGLK